MVKGRTGSVASGKAGKASKWEWRGPEHNVIRGTNQFFLGLFLDQSPTREF